MKLAVHWPPAVSVWTPGWMVAVASGAQATWASAGEGPTESTPSSPRMAAERGENGSSEGTHLTDLPFRFDRTPSLSVPDPRVTAS